MKVLLAVIASLASSHAFAAPLTLECNFMSTSLAGRFIKGRAVLITLQDNASTTARLEAFTEPFDMDGYYFKVENKTCIEDALHCSDVTMTFAPTGSVNVLSQSINKYPQRQTAKSENSNTASFQVIDQDYHPMKAAIVTYEAKAQIENYADRALNIKMACILKR